MWTRILFAAALAGLSLPCLASTTTLVWDWDLWLGFEDAGVVTEERFTGTRRAEGLAPGTHQTNLVTWMHLSVDGVAMLRVEEYYSPYSASYWAVLTSELSLRGQDVPPGGTWWGSGIEISAFTTISDTITLHNGPPGDVPLWAVVNWDRLPYSQASARLPSTVHFDQPFEIFVDFALRTSGSYTAADLGISSLQLLDSQYQPLAGYSYSSRLGHQYPFVGGTFVAIPEPALVSCVAISLIGILGAAARKTNRRARLSRGV